MKSSEGNLRKYIYHVTTTSILRQQLMCVRFGTETAAAWPHLNKGARAGYEFFKDCVSRLDKQE